MADYDEEEENEEITPKDLRKQLAKAKKDADDLRNQLAEFSKQNRQRTVEEFLTSKGLPPKVAKLLPADVEASAESLDSWLSEYQDVLGLQPKATDEEDADEIDEETKTAHQRVADAGSNALPAGKPADLEQKIKGFETPEAMTAWLRSGAPL